MTAGSLFSGIAGFDRGFALAGIEPQWACETEPACRRILHRHWPELPVFEDVRECGAHNLSPVDVISFGSPCQDLSIAGKRDGLEGKRSSLFYEAIRICRELRPAFAVWENVPGALSSNDGRDFAAILAALRECGARDLCWRVLDSRYFGVAQRRRRVFVVADFRGERAGEVLFESESLRGNPEASGGAGEDLAGTLGSSPTGGFGKLDTGGGSETLIAFDTAQITSKTNRSKAEPGMPCPTLHRGGGAHVAAPLTAPCGKGGFTDPVNDNVLSFNWMSGLGMTCSEQDVGTSAKSQHPACLKGSAVRRLLPIECERLQGFPDRWTEGESDSARYQALGNAVTVPVARWIGRRIMEASHA